MKGKIINDEVKIPHSVNARIKDLVNPIVIRRTTLWKITIALLLIAIASLIIRHFFFAPPNGEELLAEVVEAAGGMEQWNRIHEGTYTRIRTVYDENGNIIKQQPTRYYFRKGSKGFGLVLETVTDEGLIKIGFDGNEYWAIKNGELVPPEPLARSLGYMCESDKCTPLCSAEMSFYRFSIPFKLTDPGAIPKYIGSKELNGRPVALLEVTFKPNVGRDRWVFYVDKESKLIQKVEHFERVNSVSPPEEIYWSDYRTEFGITFSHRNTYYRSNGSILEEYKITNVDFKTPLSDDIFKKPEI